MGIIAGIRATASWLVGAILLGVIFVILRVCEGPYNLVLDARARRDLYPLFFAVLIVAWLAVSLISNTLLWRVFPNFVPIAGPDALSAMLLIVVPLPIFVFGRVSFGYVVGLYM